MNIKTGVKIAVSFSLMGYLLWSVDLHRLADSLKNVNPVYLIAIYLTFIPGTLISTFKWMILLKTQGIHKPNFVRLWVLYHIGIFFSNFLPTEVGGDVVRGYIVGKESGKQAESLAAVVMERVTGLTAVVFYAILGLFLNWSLARDLNLSYLVFIVTAMMGVGGYAVLNRNLAKLIKTKLSFSFFDKVMKKAESLYEAIYRYKTKTNTLSIVIGISLIFQLYAIWFNFALMRCMRIDLSFLCMIFIIPVITIIGLVPITINSIGIREGAFVFLFAQVGVSEEKSLALALLYRAGVMAPGLVGALLYTFSNNGKDLRSS